ncbi:MAG: dCMP deaminase family protein [Neomegalonema sp.]|nr:dCMP deaminase family protein [Neomegalonema sp.]
MARKAGKKTSKTSASAAGTTSDCEAPALPAAQELGKWDQRYFQICAVVASWSEDQSRQVGCVIVGPAKEIRATGYNGFPRGVNGKVDARHSRDGEEKYFWFEHAERNALYNAARSGVSTEGCCAYVSLFPCAECARAFIQSGITELHAYVPPERDRKYARSFEVSRQMLHEAGVVLKLFEKPKEPFVIQP